MPQTAESQRGMEDLTLPQVVEDQRLRGMEDTIGTLAVAFNLAAPLRNACTAINMGFEQLQVMVYNFRISKS